MQIDIVTIFPAMFDGPLATGILGRAIERGTIIVKVHDLRAFTTDRHRVVDDVPYGGGPGMVLKPEPLFRALNTLAEDADERPHVVLTSPQGERLTEQMVERLSAEPRIVLLCGRYEGVDERVRERVDEEISIGDYVLSGGELPALVIVDAVARLVPGVVGDGQSVMEDSFRRGLLDFPQYTRPADVSVDRRDIPDAATLKVPDVLLSGNHAEIRRWRKREAVLRTLVRRPDLLATASLDEEERAMLDELKSCGSSALQKAKADLAS
jgi:tRNA (guanine37-N1)-methyltransferase